MSQLTDSQLSALREYVVSQPDLKALGSEGRDADIAKALQETVGESRSNIVSRDKILEWLARRANPAKVNIVHQTVLTGMEQFNLGNQFLFDLLLETTSAADGASDLELLAGKPQTRAKRDLGFEVTRHQQVSRALRPLRPNGRVTQL